MDRRQQKTRQAILTAFRTLLEREKLNQITVQEIIDKANIGRSTFYAHFETKDDLLKVLCEELFQHIITTATDSTHTHGTSFKDGIPASVCCHLLHHLKEDSNNILILLSGENSELFLRYFKESLNCLIETYFFEHYSPEKLPIPRDYLVNHISCTFVETVLWWVHRKCVQTPEELTVYLLAVIQPIM